MVKTAVDHRDLKVYSAAMESAMAIFQASKKFPVEERYSLTDQIRKSSRSVCANIAEAWRKRSYKAAFISTLTIAQSEAGETRVWLEISHRCGYLDASKFMELDDCYDHICRMLNRMTNSPEKWCQPKAL